MLEPPRSQDVDAGSSTATDRRGQSEVIGVVLLVSIVILGSVVVLLMGSTAIGESRDRAEVSAAERSLLAFDSEAGAVALGDTPVRAVDLGLTANGGDVAYRDSGWLRVSVYSEANGTQVVANESLGAVEYSHEGTTVAAQGGGVWRREAGGAVALAAPEIQYRGRTLTVPVVNTTGEPGLTDSVRITAGGPPTPRYPNRTAGFSNPPDSGAVTVTVRSAYYEAWGEYFEAETDGIVRYNDSAGRVSVTFLILPDRRTFDAGLIATSSNGELVVAGTGAYVDSYNSSAGDYAATKSADGLVKSAGDVTAKGDSLIDGNVESNGTVTLQGSTTINGSVYYGDPPAPDASKVNGVVGTTSGVRKVLPIDTFVEQYAEDVRARNDNDATGVVSDRQVELSGGGTTAELDAGRYYVHNVTLTNDASLTLNATEGDITLAVRDYVKLTKGGNVSVAGNGTVRIVAVGANETTVSPTGLGNKDVNLHVGKGSAVHVPGENASQVRVYGPRNFSATVAGSNSKSATFDGLIFAPGGDSGSGYVYVKQGDLYGLTVTGNLSVGQYGSAHYDYGLRGSSRIQSPISALESLQVTVHRIRVEQAE